MRGAGGQSSRSGGGSWESPGLGVREELLAPRARVWIQVCGGLHCQCSLTPTPPHRPKYKGKYCVGERKRFRLCSLQACPTGRPSFRQVQCSHFDAMLYKGQLHTWVPVVNDGESGRLRGH